MKFLSDFRALLIALWLGAACFFSFAVAPSAFAVLENRELAGSLVSRTLMIINLSGLAIGLIVLAGSFIRRSTLASFWIWTERFLLLLLTLACAAGQFVISWWLSSVKTSMGKPFEEVAADDPLKIQFNNLHQYSVWVLMSAMITALVLFFLIKGKSDKISAVENKDEFKF